MSFQPSGKLVSLCVEDEPGEVVLRLCEMMWPAVMPSSMWRSQYLLGWCPLRAFAASQIKQLTIRETGREGGERKRESAGAA